MTRSLLACPDEIIILILSHVLQEEWPRGSCLNASGGQHPYQSLQTLRRLLVCQRIYTIALEIAFKRIYLAGTSLRSQLASLSDVRLTRSAHLVREVALTAWSLHDGSDAILLSALLDTIRLIFTSLCHIDLTIRGQALVNILQDQNLDWSRVRKLDIRIPNGVFDIGVLQRFPQIQHIRLFGSSRTILSMNNVRVALPPYSLVTLRGPSTTITQLSLFPPDSYTATQFDSLRKSLATLQSVDLAIHAKSHMDHLDAFLGALPNDLDTIAFSFWDYRIPCRVFKAFLQSGHLLRLEVLTIRCMRRPALMNTSQALAIVSNLPLLLFSLPATVRQLNITYPAEINQEVRMMLCHLIGQETVNLQRLFLVSEDCQALARRIVHSVIVVRDRLDLESLCQARGIRLSTS